MNEHEEAHGVTTGKYMVGFILAVILTLASFIPVMQGMLDNWAVSTKVIYLIGMALIQIFVQIVFFLHLNEGPDAKWMVGSMWFGALCVFIVLGGTWWAISHLNYNMMGGSGRIVQPDIIDQVPGGSPVAPSTEAAPSTEEAAPATPATPAQ
ncbi:cytochrome o ubiquinol oxidase subunit IV [uncultured Bartonella sp.]|uniref:cytochrome o ubiquinol oxidase subunit IV n=1 Tax=uncultured Bartonella sp. TaxID=104108 RepID=UPI0025D779AF|nr:cytochrome o ubiquinol oxidase subunit IV [uncultured Bartonella sp.]